MSQYHTPIMVKEVIEGLAVQPGRWYIDATIGGGGHTQAILGAGGNVLGIDQDQQALAEVHSRLDKAEISNLLSRLRLVKANFSNLTEVLAEHMQEPLAGILLDLGVSSHQLDELDRGFSFQSENLDMRMDQDSGASAADLVAQLPEVDLTRLLFELGEERYAKSIARAIVSARRQQPIVSGQQLAEIVIHACPPSYRYGRIHPATRTFQALRMAVNAELQVLEMVLPQAVAALADQGRVAIISFHSLEDRMVKQYFATTPDLMVLSKKPIVADATEIIANPRARSAKLRVAQRHSLG